MSQLQYIAFCGGGSGGHLIPAIAVAEELLALNPDTRFLFMTSDRPIDRHILATSGLPEQSINHVTLPLRTSTRRLLFAWQCIRSALQCRRHFLDRRPDVVIGLGGFASIAAVAAAWVSGIQVVLFEQNTVPGRANRWLHRLATATFTGWPLETKWRDKWRTPLVHVGVPLRRVFSNDGINSAPPATHVSQEPRLLVLGGSQGARRLNSLVVDALANHNSGNWNLQIVHQTGLDDHDRVRGVYKEAGITADVHVFIADMPHQLTTSTLVISRSGAVALAEIAASGRASLLFPLSTSADDHQLRNAKFFEERGASVVICEDECDASLQLAEHLRRLLTIDKPPMSGQENPDSPTGSGDCDRFAGATHVQRAAMESAALKLATRNSAAAIAKWLLRLTNERPYSPN